MPNNILHHNGNDETSFEWNFILWQAFLSNLYSLCRNKVFENISQSSKTILSSIKINDVGTKILLRLQYDF